MPEDPNLIALHLAVNCYHETLQAVANCMGQACPPIGGIYRHRMNRLRARLAFDSSPEALQESSATVEKELSEYAARTSSYLVEHAIQLRAATGAVQDLVRSMAQRQSFYATRLTQFATQMETAEYPDDPSYRREVVAMQAAGLQSCIASMLQETQSLLVRVHDELAGVERRMREVAASDPVTGLMTRAELRRQIDACKADGITPVLLRFHFTGPADDEIARQIAERLSSQLRHKDLVSRWSDADFLVLFQGPPETAAARAQQILPWVGGKYLRDSGESVQIAAEVHLAEPELV